MEKSFEYRIYPNAGQRELLQKTFGCCRYVYNKALALRQGEYGQGEKMRGINSYITQIPLWKKSEAPWLAEVDSMALQQSLRDLDQAYKNFFRNPGKAGFPMFDMYLEILFQFSGCLVNRDREWLLQYYANSGWLDGMEYDYL